MISLWQENSRRVEQVVVLSMDQGGRLDQLIPLLFEWKAQWYLEGWKRENTVESSQRRQGWHSISEHPHFSSIEAFQCA
jgi:hypothetical protein